MSTTPNPNTAPGAEDDSSLLDAVIPSWLQGLVSGLPGLSALQKRSIETRDMWAIALFAAAIFIPWLGAVGLWDPWEPHYAEVARQMVARRDYVYPYWESAYFYSKPPLLMWMMSVGMNLLGMNDVPMHTALPKMTEWFLRMPVALLAIAGIVVLCLAIHRIFGRRLAFLTGFILATSPHYFFIARQLMEDMPLVACVEISLGAFLIAEFTKRPGTEEPADPMWWYVMYAFAGFATLAKMSLGIALPGVVVFSYLLLSGDWKLLLRARLLPGILTFLAIAGPWYLTLIMFDGHDDEWSTFSKRLVHDNFSRFFGQVHTTTPAWDFTYFVEQLGWGFFPWVALIPGAIVAMGRLDRTDTDPKVRASLFFAGWSVGVFTFFTFSGTKFHHYILPALPGLAFCVAYFIDRLWREGLDRFTPALFAAFAILGMVGQNLHTWRQDQGPVSGLKHFTDLFVYNYTRPYPFGLDRPDQFAAILLAGAAIALLGMLWRSKVIVNGAFGGLAVALAIWGSWFFWRQMSHHWTQRDQFTALYAERQPNEPTTGFILGAGWRGETFYGRNSIKEINEPNKLLAFVSQPGPEFVIVEQARVNNLKQALGDKFSLRIVDRSSNKFFLVEVD